MNKPPGAPGSGQKTEEPEVLSLTELEPSYRHCWESLKSYVIAYKENRKAIAPAALLSHMEQLETLENMFTVGERIQDTEPKTTAPGVMGKVDKLFKRIKL